MTQEQYTIGGFTNDELKAAFNKVKPLPHWKDSIRSVVQPDALAVTVAAIAFYTATDTTVTIRSTGDYLIKAPGYQAGPAGDH